MLAALLAAAALMIATLLPFAAGLLVLLLTVAAFLRLDEWAGGAYTRGLRTGLRRLLGAPGAGLRSLVGRKRPSGGRRGRRGDREELDSSHRRPHP